MMTIDSKPDLIYQQHATERFGSFPVKLIYNEVLYDRRKIMPKRSSVHNTEVQEDEVCLLLLHPNHLFAQMGFPSLHTVTIVNKPPTN